MGKKIETIVEDSQCEADPSVNAANKVIDQDKVHYIIGEVCSKASIPISEIADAKGVLQISPTSTNPQVTLKQDGSTKPYVFRACFIDPFQGTVMARSGRVLRESLHRAGRYRCRQGDLHLPGHRLLRHPGQSG